MIRSTVKFGLAAFLGLSASIFSSSADAAPVLNRTLRLAPPSYYPVHPDSQYHNVFWFQPSEYRYCEVENDSGDGDEGVRLADSNDGDDGGDNQPPEQPEQPSDKTFDFHFSTAMNDSKPTAVATFSLCLHINNNQYENSLEQIRWQVPNAVLRSAIPARVFMPWVELRGGPRVTAQCEAADSNNPRKHGQKFNCSVSAAGERGAAYLYNIFAASSDDMQLGFVNIHVNGFNAAPNGWLQPVTVQFQRQLQIQGMMDYPELMDLQWTPGDDGEPEE